MNAIRPQAPGLDAARAGGPRLVLVGGKGGTGKTTVACGVAIARAQAEPGRAVHLVSTDPAHSVADALDGDAAGRGLPANLRVIELDADALQERFLNDHRGTLRAIAERGTFFDGEDVDGLLDLSMPGMDELMAALEIARLVEAADRPVVVVDTAPTGHALRLMEMPRMLGSWLDALDALLEKHRTMTSLFGSPNGEDELEGFIERHRDLVDGLDAALCDEAECRFVPVALAEGPVLEETGDLLDRLGELGVPVGEVVVNRLVPMDAEGPLADRRREQVARLAAADPRVAARPLLGLPLLEDEPTGGTALAGLAARLLPLPPAADLAALAARERGGPAAPCPVEGRVRLALSGRPAVLFTAGKGGTGKTTVAAATAIELAARGAGRVLLVSTDPAGSLADCLQVPVDATPSAVVPALGSGLAAMQVDAHAELEQLRDRYRREIEGLFEQLLGDLDLAHDREVMERLLDLAPPGLDELMSLVRVLEVLDENGADVLVIDTAPTGHMLRLLETPEILGDWIARLLDLLLKYDDVVRLPEVSEHLVRLSRGAKRLRGLLLDPEHAAMLPVAIPTRLSLAETGDLLEACRRRGLPVAGIVLNQVQPEGDPGALAAGLVRREKEVRRGFERLAAGMPVAVIRRGTPPLGAEALAGLGAALLDHRRDEAGADRAAA